MDNLQVFSILSVTLIMVLLTIRYIWQLIKKEIKPALAMWIMFSVAVGMSLLTYLEEGNYGFLDNILNTVDLLYVFTVTIAIAFLGDNSSRLTRFDKGCLLVVLVIVIFWVFTQNHFITNLLIQTILVIAYFPVIKRILESGENSEPFLIWIGMLVAPVFSLLSSKGLLATVYSVRAIICVGLLLLLMLWTDISEKKRKRNQLQINQF